SPDYYPTMLEIADVAPIPDQKFDGVSITPLLREEALEREAIYWHYPHYGNQGGTPGSSVRAGDYKLIEFFESGHFELYNLRDDIGEDNDLADTLPDVRDRLKAMLHTWRDSVEAKIPEMNPDFEPWQENPVWDR
ncbi:MAG: DUF4976 domain-containing protein, partial [Candidatus Latescibacteria bacterium]|nr:DUF4976 domain-containing protein [Candidatus Latescibacterota bacterium]